jgi:hypothetical protein
VATEAALYVSHEPALIVFEIQLIGVFVQVRVEAYNTMKLEGKISANGDKGQVKHAVEQQLMTDRSCVSLLDRSCECLATSWQRVMDSFLLCCF